MKSEAENLDDQLNNGKYTTLLYVHHCLLSQELIQNKVKWVTSFSICISFGCFCSLDFFFLLHRREAAAWRCSEATEWSQNQTGSTDEEPDNNSEQPQLNYKYAHSVHKIQLHFTAAYRKWIPTHSSRYHQNEKHDSPNKQKHIQGATEERNRKNESSVTMIM